MPTGAYRRTAARPETSRPPLAADHRRPAACRSSAAGRQGSAALSGIPLPARALIGIGSAPSGWAGTSSGPDGIGPAAHQPRAPSGLRSPLPLYLHVRGALRFRGPAVAVVSGAVAAVLLCGDGGSVWRVPSCACTTKKVAISFRSACRFSYLPRFRAHRTVDSPFFACSIGCIGNLVTPVGPVLRLPGSVLLGCGVSAERLSPGPNPSLPTLPLYRLPCSGRRRPGARGWTA